MWELFLPNTIERFNVFSGKTLNQTFLNAIRVKGLKPVALSHE
jgi:hypothetical protein